MVLSTDVSFFKKLIYDAVGHMMIITNNISMTLNNAVSPHILSTKVLAWSTRVNS